VHETTPNLFTERRAIAHCGFEQGQTFAYQEPSDMEAAPDIRRKFLECLGSRGRGMVRRELYRLSRHLHFDRRDVTGKGFDDVPVAIAGRKIHAVINARGILSEGVLDQADTLKELMPIERGEQSQTRYDAAGGQSRKGAALVLDANQVFERDIHLAHLLLEPTKRGGNGRILVTQAQYELDEKGWVAHQRRTG
jgi:hypothetical protein